MVVYNKHNRMEPRHYTRICVPILWLSLFIIISSLSSGFGQDSAVKECYVDGHYIDHSKKTGMIETRVITSLDSLPEVIRLKAEKYIIKKVGNDYYSTLLFKQGIIIDHLSVLDSIYWVKEHATARPWQVASYGLYYEFSDIPNGIASYCASIWLDSLGNIVRDIDLPDAAKHKKKRVISISYTEAKRIIEKWLKRKKKISKKIGQLGLWYDYENKNIVWLYPAKLGYFQGPQYQIWIDAHTGKVTYKTAYFSGI